MIKLKAIILFLLISSAAFSQSLSDTIQIKEVTVKGSYTAPKTAPFSFTNVQKSDILMKSSNSEPAVLLSSTPAVTFYSDNGTGLGYIYYRLRGIDQTRINVSLNGVPMNEPEDQGIYFNNYPDFLNAISDIQIIRGAGLSKSGVSSYGGSINFSSLNFSDDFKVNAMAVYGSFNTFQLSGGVNTKNFFIRGTYLSTDGYKYNSGNKSGSVFYGAKLGKFKWNGFVGQQENQMAWMGETLDSIKKDPRYNSQGPKETDKFLYVHNQFNYMNKNFTSTVFYTYLNGWYDTDYKHFGYPGSVGRVAVNSNWVGGFANYNIKDEKVNINVGLSGYVYARNHEGLTDGTRDYYNTGFKNEISPYTKIEYKFGTYKRFTWLGDVQLRINQFSYDGDEEFVPVTYHFFNWSTGLTFRIKDKSLLYYSIGRTYREPTRTDMFGGENYVPEYYVSLLPEAALDQELGFKYTYKLTSLRANFYYMDFNNELVLNGKYGPNAILLHENVDKSMRSGIELDFRHRWYNGFEVRANGNVSYNQIRAHDSVKTVTFQPILTPNTVLNLDGIYNIEDAAYIGFNLRYNSSSFIDLSNDTTLPSFSVVNVYVGVKFKDVRVMCTVNNLLNKVILTNGVIGFDYVTPKYFVMSSRNIMLSLRYGF